MLTYRDYVYAAITDYNAAMTAVVTIPEQVEAERHRREGLRAQKTDGDRVTGGDTRSDDAILSSIAKEDYLTHQLDAARHTIESMKEAVEQLDEEEREIFTRLLIRRGRYATAELAEEWGVDERTVFRAKDRVLKKLARLLTGEARA